ncbi:hypothetical protein ACTPOK_43000 [Streptomyces inhibens]|uniref:hypothetical protein n=1 Tax=Streptomyces inhibens TaxID=2293571 RepID=UPI00402A772B
MRQQLLRTAAALPTALAGAPWWAIVVCVLLGPMMGQLRGLLRDRALRKLDAFLMKAVDELADPQDKTRVLIDYRRAGGAGPADSTVDGRHPEDPGPA